MSEFESFIPEDMMLAPEHPLDKNFERTQTSEQTSSTENQKIQQSDRTSGLVKRLIPIDNSTFWEYWWCVPGQRLLPEDVQLLQSDRFRLETILSKILWLWGGYCCGEATILQESELIHDWQKVLNFVQQQGLKPDVIDVDFLPLTVKTDTQNSNPESSTPKYVAVEPAHWHIEFFQLQPKDGGFELQEPKKTCGCQIWTRKPFIKHLETGEVTNRFDLWLSQPLDLTNPPWQSVLDSEQG